ncbi:TRAP transporter small permease [Phaeovulum sp. W22_SRMD_FR3]|uniref:TRAP transporter small permease n=1 Tax=Phaeovulum sp. W22_SRMD_FR3 TaxID=3240274 RepID=UPI003F9E51D8
MTRQSPFLHRAADGLSWGTRTLGALAVAGFAAIIVYVVFARYVLAYTPRWAEEIPRLLLIWVTFVGMISGVIRKSHLCAGITDLIFGTKGPLRRALAFLAWLATASFLVILIYTGAQLTRATWSHETPALSLPVGLFYLALPVCAALALVGLVVSGGRE